jgi:hypothetical protein
MYIHAYIFTYTCIHTYIYDISLHIFGGRRGKKRGGKHIHTLTHTYIHMIHREAGSRKPSKKKGGEGKHIAKNLKSPSFNKHIVYYRESTFQDLCMEYSM